MISHFQQLILLSASFAVAFLSCSSSQQQQSILVSAAADNPCTKGWNPGQNYTSMSCSGGALGQWMLDNVVLAVLPIVVGLIIWWCTHWALIFRYCCQCCGGSKQRPGHFCMGGQHWDDLPPEDVKIGYDNEPKTVLFTKIITVIAAILTIVAAGVSFAGASKVAKFPEDLLNGAVGFADWIIAGTDEIVAGLPGQGSSSYNDYTSVRSSIDSAKTEINNIKKQITDFSKNVEIVKPASMGLAGPTIGLAICGLIGVLCLIASIRTCIPLLVILLTCWFALTTGALGTVGSVITLGTDLWCSEVDAFKAGGFGVFNNYLLPQICEQDMKMSSVRSQLAEGTNTVTTTVCQSILNACSAGAVYANDGKFYQCDNPITCTNGVTTPNDVSNLINSLTVKTGIVGETQCNTGTCTIKQCATQCTETNVRDASVQINDKVTVAVNVLSLINRVTGKYLNCRNIFTQFVNFFDICKNLHAGLKDVTAGAGVGLTSAILLIIAMMLGQKRFFKRTGFNKEEAELTLIARY